MSCVLHPHNTYGQMHQSPPLTLSTDLNESAQSWADHQLDRGARGSALRKL
uniref:SCP domain-containing protein n=1 Tax=Gadus morhua TaxID=8049 RepID=A0A8C5CJ70_GADMO